MADIKIYTTKWSTDCDQAKEFLDDEGRFAIGKEEKYHSRLAWQKGHEMYDHDQVQRIQQQLVPIQGIMGNAMDHPAFERMDEAAHVAAAQWKSVRRRCGR